MTRKIKTRRKFIKSSLAGASVVALAGCGSDGGDGGGDGSDGDGDGGSTPTATVAASDEAQQIVSELPDYYPSDYAEVVQGAMDEGSLTLYTGHFGTLSESYIETFTNRFSFIDVEVINLASAQVFERFSTEASQDVWEPDLVHSPDAVALNRFKQLEILQNYESPEEEHIRDGFKSDDGMVMAPDFMPYAHAWHPPEADDPPMTLPDIAEAVDSNPDRWEEKICMYDGVLSTAMWQMMYLWSNHYGREEMEEYLRMIAPAQVQSFWSTSTMGEWVATGEVDLGINLAEFIMAKYVRPDYGEDVLAWGPDEDIIFPAFYGGYVMPKEVSNPNAAKLFYDWWLSQEGQAFLANEWKIASGRTDMGEVVESTYNIPNGDDVPLTYEGLTEITPSLLDYKELSQAGAEKEEFKNLWYEIFVAGA